MAQPVTIRTSVARLGMQPGVATTLGALPAPGMPSFSRVGLGRVGLGDVYADIARYRATLRDLATAIKAAKQSGQTVAAQMLQAQWRQVNALLRAAVAALNATDTASAQPSGIEAGLRALLDGLKTAGLVGAIGLGVLLLGPPLLNAIGRRRRG